VWVEFKFPSAEFLKGIAALAKKYNAKIEFWMKFSQDLAERADSSLIQWVDGLMLTNQHGKGYGEWLS